MFKIRKFYYINGCILDIIIYTSKKTTIYVIKFPYFEHFFNFFPVKYFLLGCFWFLMDYLHVGVCSFPSSFFISKSSFRQGVRTVNFISKQNLISIYRFAFHCITLIRFGRKFMYLLPMYVQIIHRWKIDQKADNYNK